MRVEQMVYTSCPKGLGAGAGFQTQAASAGMADADRIELEGRGVYYYPRSLPPNPSAEEIKKYCPPNLQFAPLSNGSLGVTRSVYTGADYSGRHGNYLAHSVLLPADSSIWPIDLARWSGWLDRTSDEPPALTSLDSFELQQQIDSALGFVNLAEFIRTAEGGRERLRDMVRALLKTRASNRAIVIRDQDCNVDKWIACLTKLFPRRCNPPFSFATFLNKPTAKINIAGTTANSDWEITSADVGHNAFVFDFVESRFSTVDGQPGDYADYMADTLCNDPTGLTRFNEFAKHFNLSIDAAQLQLLLDWWRLFNDEADSGGTSHQRWSELLAFAGDSALGTSEAREQMNALIHRASSTIQKDRKMIARAPIVECLASLAEQVDDPSLFETVWHTCKELLWTELGEGGRDWALIDARVAKLTTRMNINPKSLSASLFDDKAIGILVDRIGTKPEIVKPVLLFITSHLAASGEPAIWTAPPLHRFIRLAIKASSPETVIVPTLTLAAETSDATTMSQLCIDLQNASDTRECQLAIARGLIRVLDVASAAKRTEIRRSLLGRGATDLLLKEAVERRGESSNDLPGFLQYLEQMDGSCGRQLGDPFLEFIATVWQKCSDDEREVMAEWFSERANLILRLDPKTSREVVKVLNDIVSLDPSDRTAAKQAKRLENLCRQLKVTPTPDRIAIRSFVDQICRGKFQSIEAVRTRWTELSRDVDVLLATDFADITLPVLIATCSNPKDHWQVLLWGCTIAGQEQVARIYSETLQSRAVVKLPDEAAASYVVATLSWDTSSVPKQLGEVANSALDGWLFRISKRQLDRMGTCVAANGRFLGKHKVKEWKTRVAAVQRARGSILGRVRRFFGVFRR